MSNTIGNILLILAGLTLMTLTLVRYAVQVAIGVGLVYGGYLVVKVIL